MMHKDIQIGDKVIYIPADLLTGEKSEMIKEKNLGIVTSKNDRFIFVRYKDQTNSQATGANDLFTLKYRPDLAELI